MRAAELMRENVVTIRESDPVDDVLDVLVGEHIHGAPVVDDRGELVGVISQLDIYFGKMTRNGKTKPSSSEETEEPLIVHDVMTAPAVSAAEETDVVDLCRLMYKLRIHRVPVVRKDKVLGIISSLDICNAVATGRLIVKE
jgi:CBS domain-containing protein